MFNPDTVGSNKGEIFFQMKGACFALTFCQNIIETRGRMAANKYISFQFIENI